MIIIEKVEASSRFWDGNEAPRRVEGGGVEGEGGGGEEGGGA